MKAFVLGAGLGTRLRPLTENRPKPLGPLYGKPLITFAFDHLLASGVTQFFVNTHHCPEAYDRIFPSRQYRGRDILFRHEPVLLDTGGGIKNMEDVLDDSPFIAYNGDVLADFPLTPAIESHRRNGNLATLVLRSTGGLRNVRARNGLVTDLRGTLGREDDPAFLFTGITILSPEIFRHIPAGEILSVVPVYLDLIRRGARVGAEIIDAGLWEDLGTRESYLEVHKLLRPGGGRLTYLPGDWPTPVEAGSHIASTAKLEGVCSIGSGASIGAEAILRDSVVWKNAVVAPGSRLTRCVVREGVKVAGAFEDTDL